MEDDKAINIIQSMCYTKAIEDKEVNTDLLSDYLQQYHILGSIEDQFMINMDPPKTWWWPWGTKHVSSATVDTRSIPFRFPYDICSANPSVDLFDKDKIKALLRSVLKLKKQTIRLHYDRSKDRLTIFISEYT